MPSDARHGGEQVVAVLAERGVGTLFTLCGGHISPVLTAAHARGLAVVDVRHEASAVFAAEAWGRVTGGVGVAVVTAGPGITNCATALESAHAARAPLLVVAGAAPSLLRGRGALQDMDQRAAIGALVKRFVRVRRRRQLSSQLAAAFDLAAAPPAGPVVVECPVDVLYPAQRVAEWYAGAAGPGRDPISRARRWYIQRYTKWVVEASGQGGARVALAAPAAPSAEVQRVLRRLATAERPVILLGSQAADREAGETLEALERLGAPVFPSGAARGLMGRAHPLLMRHRRREALRDADVVVLAGVPCDFRLDYGRSIRRGTVLVALNADERLLTLNRRPTLGVRAAPAGFLRALAAAAPEPPDRTAWVERLRARDLEREGEIDAWALQAVHPLNPVALCRAIDAALPEDACVVVDGGDFVGTAAHIVRPHRPLAWLDAGPFGALGAGPGFILGAHASRRFGEIWALFGDGALGLDLGEFHTFVRQRVPLVAVIGNDGRWAEIGRAQMELLGDPVGTELGRVDYERVVAGFGCRGMRLEDPAETASVLAEARRVARSGVPVLVNAMIGESAFREGSIAA